MSARDEAVQGIQDIQDIQERMGALAEELNEAARRAYPVGSTVNFYRGQRVGNGRDS